MPNTNVLRQSTPGPLCGTTNVFTGAVMAQAISNTKANAEKAAKAAARAAAMPGFTQDRTRKCPVNCRPGQLRGDNQPKLTKVRVVQIRQAPANADWVAYYAASWRVVRICPAAKGEGGKSKKKGRTSKRRKTRKS